MRATNSTGTEPATGGTDPTQAWKAATGLADWVGGGRLPKMPSPVLLGGGEVQHADLPAQGWRFHGADVTYIAPHVVAIGGPLMFGLTAAGSALARRADHKPSSRKSVGATLHDDARMLAVAEYGRP